jgi:alpha-N-acetylglucosamine transferase
MGSNSEHVNGAYAVLLTSDSYAIGARVLAWSLKSFHTEYPFVVLYTSDTLSGENIRALDQLGCLMREVERIKPEQGDSGAVQTYYADVWTKLHVFGLAEFDRIVLLDADMLVRRNFDELMTMSLPGDDWIAACSGCLCNPLKIPTFPAHW